METIGENMKNNLLSCKSAIAPLLIVVILVIVVGGIAAGAYVLSQSPPGPSPSPTPTGTTPTPSSGFPTPTPSQTTANMRVGAYAHYLVTMYVGGSPATTSTVKLTVDGEESYMGTPCWIYTMATEPEIGSIIMKTTRWLSKSTLECMHIRVQTYQGGNLIDDQEYAGDSNEGSEMPNIIKPTVGYETITVTAGTFENCAKGETGGSTGDLTVLGRSWTHTDVPIWGLVKLETYSNDNPVSSYELTAYGG